jgi:cytochrome c oxidase subunit 2
MVGDIVVMEPAQYEAWINSGATGPLSASGEKVFAELGCSTCHRSDVQGRGPNLQGVFGHPVQLEDGRTVTADENYLRECILDPGSKRLKGFQPIMPTFQGLVNEEQVNALVAYIKSMSDVKPTGTKTNASAARPESNVQAQAQVHGSQVQ